MTFKAITAATGFAALAVLMAQPAQAQKTKDTLRVAYQDPISTADAYADPKPETAVTQTAIFETLIYYDPASKEFKPDLAESWKRIDDKTLEFKLRHGVKFHDGSEFTADDVVYMITWLLDPNTKLRFGANWRNFDRAEKIDDYTVRIMTKRPVANDLMQLAINTVIFPKKVFSSFENKADFGRKSPIGTGPYKLESIDSSKGIVLVKNPDYKSPGPWRPAATIGRIVIIPIPDLQTQIAQLMTGGIDLMHDVPKDQAQNIASDPRYTVSVAPGLNFFYLWLDAANRSGVGALAKPEVRKAIAMALDRNSLAKNIAPGTQKDPAQSLDILCVKVQAGCAGNSKPPAYDMAGAKKLLADAGYPDGLDLEVVTNTGSEQMGQAVSGELRKIGIRSKVENLTFVSYRERQAAGKIQLLSGSWSSGGVPDVAVTMDFFFDGGARDYSRDKTLTELGEKALAELDPAKRAAIYAEAFDRSNANNYVIPLTTLPTLFAHPKDVEVETTSVNAQALDLFLVHWK